MNEKFMNRKSSEILLIDITPLKTTPDSPNNNPQREKYLIFKNAIFRGFFTKSIFNRVNGPFFGSLSTGEFIIEGKALIILPNSGFILGHFSKGRCHGDCMVKFGNGDVIAGKFQHGIMHGIYIYFDSQEQKFWIEKYSLGRRFERVFVKSGVPGFKDFSEVCDPEELIIGKFLEENNFIHCELMDCGNLFIGSEDLKFGFSLSNEYLIHAVGFFEADNLEGYGRLYKNQDLIIEGYFKDGNIHGKAILYSISHKKFTLSHYDFGFERVVIKKGRNQTAVPLCRKFFFDQASFYSIELKNLELGFECIEETFKPEFLFFDENFEVEKKEGFSFPFNVDELYSIQAFNVVKSETEEREKRYLGELMEVINEESGEDFNSNNIRECESVEIEGNKSPLIREMKTVVITENSKHVKKIHILEKEKSDENVQFMTFYHTNFDEDDKDMVYVEYNNLEKFS